ncbi:FAD-dependent oxidoreductase [Francisellaceae bacterium]|nr:FAD-dependent oxidoreductase [Francisellaceae bacterium]
MNIIQTDICVIGGGSGGLSVAAGAVQMGARVVLCEGNEMGGDCLNYGCVPSKSLIEASKANTISQQAKHFGIHHIETKIDFGQVNDHIRNVIQTISKHDSVERFESLGVKVIQEFGELVDHKTVKAGEQTIQAKYIVLAPGSRSKIPNIKGLQDTDYYTNETIFDLKEKPEHLVVIGAGPIGCEIAQAYNQLGCKVSILEAGTKILPAADRDCVSIIETKLKDNGIEIFKRIKLIEFDAKDMGAVIHYEIAGEPFTLEASHILVAAGRSPNLERLNLDNAGIKHTPKGVVVDKRLRTNKKNVYAIGDIASPYQFTHTAGYHAGIVIRNILFKLPAKVDYSAFPWVTYVNPELAHVGLNIQEAESEGAQVLQLTYNDNDRAQAGLHTNGLIKVAVGKKGKILGATIVGEDAGELISQWTLAIANKLTIKNMTSYIIPYPTLSELNKRVAGTYYTKALFSKKTQKIVRFLMKWL